MKRHMLQGVEFAAIALLVTLGAFVAALAYKEPRVKRSGMTRTRRVLRRTAPTQIASLVDGKLACVVGRVERDDEMLTAILSRTQCVAYEIVEWRKGVRRAIVPFFVADDSGRVRIDAGEAALLMPPTVVGETFEERIVEVGARIRIVGSVRIEAAIADANEHGFREGATTAQLTGSSKFPLLLDLERD
jgi:hypothetical protein